MRSLVLLFWLIEHPGQVPEPPPLDVEEQLLSQPLLDVLELKTGCSHLTEETAFGLLCLSLLPYFGHGCLDSQII